MKGKKMMKTIAICTNFREFNPGYSLTSIVKNQCLMLRKHGHPVKLLVAEDFKGEVPDYKGTEVVKCVPHGELIDYRTREDVSHAHMMMADRTAQMLVKELKDVSFVITHDWVFTGWNLPYAFALRQMNEHLPKLRWGHWIHSIPSSAYDWWRIREYGAGHRLVFPVKALRTNVAEQFWGHLSHVRTVPHIVDLRTLHDFSSEAWEFIDEFPGAMSADIVQVYPASTDRLRAKKIRECILMFRFFKEMGLSVCLIIANQHATGKAPREDLARYQKIAHRNGLKLQSEFIFTSEWKKKYHSGMPQSLLVELYHLVNLLVYPTQEESFGLVGPEVALTGGALLVLNKSLELMFEVHGWTGLYVDFGSFQTAWETENEKAYYESVANLIVGRMQENESINSKTFHRQKHNMDFLYKRYYAPLFEESRVW